MLTEITDGYRVKPVYQLLSKKNCSNISTFMQMIEIVKIKGFYDLRDNLWISIAFRNKLKFKIFKIKRLRRF